MADALLHAIHAWRDATELPWWCPSLRMFGVVVIGFCWGAALAVLQPDDVLGDIRKALRHAGLSDKEASFFFKVGKATCSKKLSGVHPLTVQKLALLPVEFWQWWAVVTAVRHGVPAPVTTGARLARRQARMSLASHNKEGAA